MISLVQLKCNRVKLYTFTPWPQKRRGFNMLINDMEDKELFQLSNDVSGELEPYNNPTRTLKKDTVYVLLDNALRKIFLWIGQSAGVRSRFIASNAAHRLQRIKGLSFRVITVDGGDETTEFIQRISTMIMPEQFDQ